MSIAAIPSALGGAAFERLMAPFAPFERHPDLAVAVSGGRDSLCLALLASEWAVAREGRAIALIVDHGLRRESLNEALATSRLLEGVGIESAVLRWTGDKPQTGLQEAARDARYRLLRQACRERGILHLLVGHHADDQDETIAMRAARSSGPDGLAGMAALVEWPEVRLLRPLLAVRRAALTATLEVRGVPWIDDPSNVDPRFERARLRLAGVSDASRSDADLVRVGHERAAAEAGVMLLEAGEQGCVALDPEMLQSLPLDLRGRLMSRIVQAIGGRRHQPRRERLDRALARLSGPLERGKSGRESDFTLSGCQFLLRQAVGSRRLVWIVRPESGRKDRQPLIPAEFFACDPAAATHL